MSVSKCNIPRPGIHSVLKGAERYLPLLQCAQWQWTQTAPGSVMGLCVPLSHSHEHLLYQSILAQPSLPAGSSEGRSSVPFFMFSFFFENLTQYILVIFLYFPQVFFPDPPTSPYPPNFMFCLFYYKINTHTKNKTKIKTSVCSVLASYSWA